MNQKKAEEFFHQPALLNEVVQFLNIKPGQVYIDATIGGGGHSLAVLKKGGKVLGIDWDSQAVEFANKRLSKACPSACFKVVKDNFVNLEEILNKNKIKRPAGILFDLGVSFHQLKTKGRGFSFAINEPLDMRMSFDLKTTAKELINSLKKDQLYELFSRLGEEKFALPIAEAVISTRRKNPIKDTGQLASLVKDVYRQKKEKTRIHPATKVFQALRIAVNNELDNLKKALFQAGESLGEGGRLVVISFHGLEDRIVKKFLRRKQKEGEFKILTKKPLRPKKREKLKNPSARSARLRCGEKK